MATLPAARSDGGGMIMSTGARGLFQLMAKAALAAFPILWLAVPGRHWRSKALEPIRRRLHRRPTPRRR